jgi:hypothetical protein
MMKWSNFAYVLETEGWWVALKLGFWSWVICPWKTARIKVAKIIISILRVKEEFDME